MGVAGDGFGFDDVGEELPFVFVDRADQVVALALNHGLDFLARDRELAGDAFAGVAQQVSHVAAAGLAEPIEGGGFVEDFGDGGEATGIGGAGEGAGENDLTELGDAVGVFVAVAIAGGHHGQDVHAAGVAEAIFEGGLFVGEHQRQGDGVDHMALELAELSAATDKEVFG